MAGALGWAATQPPAQALTVFAALGIGFATPFTLVSFIPGLHKRLPRPGPWMERFKQFLAFPMFATAVWLAWVLAQQTGGDGAGALLSVFTAVSFALWAWRQGGVAWRALGVIVVAVVGLFAWTPLSTVSSPAVAAADDPSAWSPARVAEARASGAPVFVNFTADWCVTCKANEAVALSRPRVQEAFAAQGVVYLKGDWTRRDAAIAAELATHGRSGVPLYLYFAPGADAPMVLPQLLTEATVLDAIGGGAAFNEGEAQ
jgi:thiol:disulfide interchange protein